MYSLKLDEADRNDLLGILNSCIERDSDELWARRNDDDTPHNAVVSYYLTQSLRKAARLHAGVAGTTNDDPDESSVPFFSKALADELAAKEAVKRKPEPIAKTRYVWVIDRTKLESYVDRASAMVDAVARGRETLPVADAVYHARALAAVTTPAGASNAA